MSYHSKIYKKYELGILTKKEFNKRLNIYYRIRRLFEASKITLAEYRSRLDKGDVNINQCQRCTVLTGKNRIHKKLYEVDGLKVCKSCREDLSKLTKNKK